MRTGAKINHFWNNRSGGFGVAAGLLGALLFGALGGALDLSRQWRATTVMQRAADAAALAGSKAMSGGTEAQAASEIQRIGKANLASDLASVTFVPSIDSRKGRVAVQAKGEVRPYFLPLLGINSLSVAASATAAIEKKSYNNFYFMLDVSESMNIAASAEDRKLLEKITYDYNRRPCAFACHTGGDDWAYRDEWKDKERISVFEMKERHFRNTNQKVRLRSDILNEASKKMVSKLLEKPSDGGDNVFTKVDTYGFSSSFIVGTGKPTDDEAAALKSIDDLRKSSGANEMSAMEDAWRSFNTRIGTQGTGFEASSPIKTAIIVTDGVSHVDEITGPVQQAWCDNIKKRGIRLAILEIKYLELLGHPEGAFERLVEPFYKRISPSLSNCASVGYYYLAEESNEAANKLSQLAQEVSVVKRRLMQ